MSPQLAPFLALLATTLLIVVLRPLAVRVGLVDVPSERKTHRLPTPLVGGIAIFTGTALAFFLCKDGPVPLTREEVYSFFGAGALLVIVGVVDDFVELKPAVRFVAQIVASLLMIFGAGVMLKNLGPMTFSGADLELGWFAVPFTLFATLGIINALNMCDGLDGLSGSLTMTSLSGLVVAAYTWGTPADTALLPILGAAIAAFLLFNVRLPGRQRAVVFMGDAGSTFLGFALTWYAISLSQGTTPVISPSATLWFLMVPIFDAVSMMIRRILKGRSPFAADREHLHHVFLLAGFTVNETVAVMAGLASLGVFIGMASVYFQVPDIVVSGGFLCAGLLYFWAMRRAWKLMRFLSISICRRRTGTDRRQNRDRSYLGPERRSGVDRRALERNAVSTTGGAVGNAQQADIQQPPARA
jgi:UDP-GlcNAc:undecaprenyl-phosphate GlcNAc-1-phosphate transferase